MTRDELIRHLEDHEDGSIERKLEGTKAADLRRTIVAFANSVPENRSAILFIGVSNDGTRVGVTNPDKIQGTVREIAEEDCYPSVRFQCEVFIDAGKDIVAVIVPASDERPHFAGAAFVRVGSQNKRASRELYEELIASRNTKAGPILRRKGELITYKAIDLDQWKRERPRYTIECRIEGCDAHVVNLLDIGSGRHFSMPLEKIRINRDQVNQRFMLDAFGE